MKRFLLSTALVTALLHTSPANAAGVPTFDGASIGQMAAQHAAELQQMAAQHTAELAELLNQLETMNNLYQNAQQQLETVQAQLASLTDVRKLSNAFKRGSNSVSSLDFSTYIDLAQYAIGAEGSVPPEVGVIIERAKLSTGLTDLENLYNSDKARDRRIAEQGAVGLSVTAMAESAMNGFKEDSERLDTIMSEVGQQPDLKAAIDYNTAVNVEVARLLNKMLLVQAMQAQAAGTTATISAAGSVASRRFTDRVEAE